MSDTEWVGCIKSALLILTRPTATRGDKWWHYNGNFWSSSPSNSHPVLSLPMPYCLLLPQSRPLGCPPVSISSLFYLKVLCFPCLSLTSFSVSASLRLSSPTCVFLWLFVLSVFLLCVLFLALCSSISRFLFYIICCRLCLPPVRLS